MNRQHYVIVVADDNKMVNEVLTELLEDRGYSVIACFSGEEAYRVSMRLQPDLVITDVMMETEDAGFRLLERLKTEPTTTSIGVIVCSANRASLERNRSLASSLGAVLLRKPFDMDCLLETLQQFLPD